MKLLINLVILFPGTYRMLQFNDDISGWDVSNVTNMEKMFYYGYSFNQDINTKEITKENGDIYIAWNVSNVTNMKHIF